jgi:hypothetical protein
MPGRLSLDGDREDRGDRNRDGDPFTGSRKAEEVRSRGQDPEAVLLYMQKGKPVGVKYMGYILPFQVVENTDNATAEGLRTAYRRGMQAIIQSMRLFIPTRTY